MSLSLNSEKGAFEFGQDLSVKISHRNFVVKRIQVDVATTTQNIDFSLSIALKLALIKISNSTILGLWCGVFQSSYSYVGVRFLQLLRPSCI